MYKKCAISNKSLMLVKHKQTVHRLGNTATMTEKSKSKSKFKSKSKSYFTLDNGKRSFKVVISEESPNQTIVQIYTYQSDGTDLNNFDPKMYTKLIKKYENVQKVFVGKSLKNAMSNFSGAHGRRFDGNSVLLKINCTIHQNYYVFVGDRIYGFSTPDDEPIETFYSTVGNNRVPYPVALSKKYIYFMLEPDEDLFCTMMFPWHISHMDRSEFPKKIVWSDAYSYYYLDSRPRFKSYIKMIQTRV